MLEINLFKIYYQSFWKKKLITRFFFYPRERVLTKKRSRIANKVLLEQCLQKKDSLSAEEPLGINRTEGFLIHHIAYKDYFEVLSA